MKVTLNINEDSELRNHVKGLISGQVKSIIRDEIKDILKGELSSKIKQTNIPSVDLMIKQEVKKIVDNELGSKGWNNPTMIQTHAKKLIAEHIKKAFEKGALV